MKYLKEKKEFEKLEEWMNENYRGLNSGHYSPLKMPTFMIEGTEIGKEQVYHIPSGGLFEYVRDLRYSLGARWVLKNKRQLINQKIKNLEEEK